MKKVKAMLEKGALYVLLGLLAVGAPQARDGYESATQYVDRLMEKVDRLENKLLHANLMLQLQRLDQRISQGTCAREAEALHAATKQRDIDRQLERFEACFNRVLPTEIANNPDLLELDLNDYRRVNTVYLDLLNTHFNGRPGFKPQARVSQLKKRIRKLKRKDQRVAAILVSEFGQVQVKQAGSAEWRPASQGMVLLTTASLKTGKRGRARIEFVDRFNDINSGPSVMNVSSSTQIRLSKFIINRENHHRNGLLEVLRGTIRWFSKGWGGQSAAFSVRTGTSLCGIRGTDVEIRFDDKADHSFYRLHSGSVQITTPNEVLQLEPGQEVSVSRGVIGRVQPIRRSLPPT